MKEKKNKTWTEKNIEKAYDDFYNKQELIWGIGSKDSPCYEAVLGGMNDIEIIFDSSCKKYYLNVETIYQFNSVQSEIDYYTTLYKELKKWCYVNDIQPVKLEKLNFNGSWSFASWELEQVIVQFTTVCLGYIDLLYWKLKDERVGNYEYKNTSSRYR